MSKLSHVPKKLFVINSPIQCTEKGSRKLSWPAVGAPLSWFSDHDPTIKIKEASDLESKRACGYAQIRSEYLRMYSRCCIAAGTHGYATNSMYLIGLMKE